MDASTPLPRTPANPPRAGRGHRVHVAACALLGLGTLSTPLHGLAQLAEPFRTRNLNPFVAMLPWPTWQVPEAGGRTQLIVAAEAASHYTFSVQGQERIALDGETWRASVFVQHALTERWSVGLEIPYLHQSGGGLDDLVDGFHSAFRLPDGGRDSRPEGALWFSLQGPAGQAYALDESDGGGLGDVQLSLARRIGAGPRALRVQAALALPTGAPERLFGSGAAGASLGVLQGLPLTWRSRPAGLYWAAAVILPGDPELPGFPLQERAYLGTLGGSWQAWPRVGFKLQLDVHSAFYESALTQLGSTGLQATLGGWWQGRPGRAIEVAVNEDLRVSTSPDVVVQVALRWRWQ